MNYLKGDAQKIEYLLDKFSRYYIKANEIDCKRLCKTEGETLDVFALAYAIVILNTVMHNKNIKQNERPKFEDFSLQIGRVDTGIDADYLQKIYERVKQNEFKPDDDHLKDVIDLEKKFISKKPTSILLTVPHRRLVCSVKLCEIYDLTKKEKLNTHQRDVFLFNDLLVVSY